MKQKELLARGTKVMIRYGPHGCVGGLPGNWDDLLVDDPSTDLNEEK